MIELAIDMCLAQAKAGRYFAFECAELVNCWRLPCMLRLYSVQNAHKLVLVTDSGERRVVVTNSQAIDSLVGVVESGAQRQPLCDAMIDGLLAECGDESHCEGVLYQFDQHPTSATQTRSACRVLTTLPETRSVQSSPNKRGRRN